MFGRSDVKGKKKKEEEVCFSLNRDDAPKKKTLAQDAAQLAGRDAHHSFF